MYRIHTFLDFYIFYIYKAPKYPLRRVANEPTLPSHTLGNFFLDSNHYEIYSYKLCVSKLTHIYFTCVLLV